MILGYLIRQIQGKAVIGVLHPECYPLFEEITEAM